MKALVGKQADQHHEKLGQAGGPNEFFATRDNQLVRLNDNKEGNCFVGATRPVKLVVENRRRGFFLKGDLSQALTEDSCRLLTMAGQKSARTIDTDFAGHHREGYRVTPGPLDCKAEYTSCLFRAMA